MSPRTPFFLDFDLILYGVWCTPVPPPGGDERQAGRALHRQTIRRDQREVPGKCSSVSAEKRFDLPEPSRIIHSIELRVELSERAGLRKYQRAGDKSKRARV